MQKIDIQLNQDYKSYDTNYSVSLHGELIILSGINGSGKSQLINIIKGKEQGDPQNQINPIQHINIKSTVKINEKRINQKKIEFKSFKDNIYIPEIIQSTSAHLTQSVNEAYKRYTKGQLNPDTLPNFSSSCLQAIKILEDNFGKGNNNIPESDFKNILRKNNFNWRNEDQFTDFIGSIFYNHAMSIAQGRQDAGKVDGPAFDESSLGIAPWTELNLLFSELNLDYRFKEKYEILHAELDEIPCLYAIDENMNLLSSETRSLKDLSDGEKSIISLCFNSLRKMEREDKRILLLDEFDAVLNPSLTESMFKVIKKYYIEKNIIVIISTHSPATISMAPLNTTFYEVFKKNNLKNRLLEINKDEYKELQLVNQRFYKKIEDQSKRINDLETVLELNEKIQIITEGKTDWKYILGALKYFHNLDDFTEITEEYFYKYGTCSDVKNCVCGTSIDADLGESQLNQLLLNEISLRTHNTSKREKILIGIFDSDTNIKIKNNPDYNVYSFKIEPDGISTEFLFSDKEIQTTILDKRLFIGNEFDSRSTRHLKEELNLGSGSQNKAGKKVIIDCDVYNNLSINQALSKESFSQAIYNHDIQIEDESWENFRHIFNKISILIKEFIPSEEVTISEIII